MKIDEHYISVATLLYYALYLYILWRPIPDDNGIVCYRVRHVYTYFASVEENIVVQQTRSPLLFVVSMTTIDTIAFPNILPLLLHSPHLSFRIINNKIVFGMDPIRPDLLQRVVTWQRNKKRGKRKAKTKTISEVSGSGRKVRNQKGGGVARAGHSRPAHWRGGAKAHGPKGSIQDYTSKLNKGVRRLGLKHALSQKLKEGNLILTSSLELESHKTKHFAAILDSHDIGGQYGATAFVIDHATANDVGESGDYDVDVTSSDSIGGINVNLKVASRNLYKVKVANQLGSNVYDILGHEKLVLSLGALKALEERLA